MDILLPMTCMKYLCLEHARRFGGNGLLTKLPLMKNDKSFSYKERIRSFRFALEGIRTFLKTEHNSWIHLLGTIVVVALAIIMHLNKIEIILLVLVIGLVWVTELLNTAIEKIMDFVSVERREEIRHIKDISAAAVLVSAIVAFITGCIIFIPKF